MKVSELDRLNQRMESVQSYNTTLENEISETREQVARLSGQINDGQD